MKKKNKLIILLSIVMIPQTILANAGTALMWMPIFQLMFGNFLIGFIEGIAVSLIYKTKWYRSILIMIGGNYASWLLGNGLILFFQESIIDTTFQLKGVFVAWIISLIFLYIVTVFIELPFFHWIFSKEIRNWKRSWKISLILNVITYTAMILIYLNVSKYNFFTDLEINQTLLNKEYNYELIIKQDNKVFKGEICDPFQGEFIYQIPEKYEYLHFELRELRTIDLLLSNFRGDTLIFQDSFVDSDERVFYPNLYEKYSFLKADFRDTTNRNWIATAGGWAIDGLTISNENQVKTRYAFEVPWMFWGIGQVSIISENELICEINDRLILLNKDTKEIAYITKADSYILKRKK